MSDDRAEVIGVPPLVTAETERFWAAARGGELLIERCLACGQNVFPPRGICPQCRGRDIEPVTVDDIGVLYSFTVNHNPWFPGMPVPYGLGLVEFPNYPGFRVLGRLRGFDLAALSVGQRLRIGFQAGPGGLPVPSFSPLEESP